MRQKPGPQGSAEKHVNEIRRATRTRNSIRRKRCDKEPQWYCNESMRPMVEQARVEFDPPTRLELLQKLMVMYTTMPRSCLRLIKLMSLASTSG